MSSDLVYSAILAVVLLFLGLWALILAIGFFLSWRDDVNEAKKPSTIRANARHERIKA